MRKHMARNESGNVTTGLALAIVPLLLSAGAAIDYYRIVDARTELQAVVDAAALAGASLEGASLEARKLAARKSFLANKAGAMAISDPIVAAADKEIVVAASATLDAGLVGIAGFDSHEIAVTATAVWSPVPLAACIIALEPSDKEAVIINSDSKIVSPDCNLHVNSSHGEALYGDSDGDVIAAKTCIRGGAFLNSGSTVDPGEVTCPPIPDPLATLPAPAAAGGACDHTDLSISGSMTLSPGVYCGKLKLNAGAHVTFLPGIYVKKDGEFILNSGASAYGTGVMFYFTGYNNSRFNINSGSHIDFKAPTSGTYAGIAFFQQRGISGADYSILNSDSTSRIEGVIYLPDTALHLNSHGALSPDTPWTMIIVDKLVVNSHSTLRVNADYAASSVPVPVLLGGGPHEAVRLIH